MVQSPNSAASQRLSGEDLTFWRLDSPLQPTTMAMLMLLDQRPDPASLRAAFERAVCAVPRLAEHVIDAPLDLTLPRWEADPTFDLDYHVRHHSLSGTHSLEELFHEIGPTYETPFDRSRPLWEARLYEGLRGNAKAAIFFKLHHAVADGLGANAIFAALTDSEPRGLAPQPNGATGGKGTWTETPPFARRLIAALGDGVALRAQRARAFGSALADLALHPQRLAQLPSIAGSVMQTLTFRTQSPLQNYGRARQLSGCELPFDAMRELRRHLGGSMIDVILTVTARTIGKWYARHGLRQVKELMTLVPVNLRTPEQWAENAHIGNVAAGILLPLPIALKDPVAMHHEIHRRMEQKKADPLLAAGPLLAEMISVLPRAVMNWASQTGFGNIDFIVTNVPGIMVPRYLAGTEIVAAYPFAPIAVRSPVSVALYGYRDRLFIGITSDAALMPDVDFFKAAMADSFKELRAKCLPRTSTQRRQQNGQQPVGHSASGLQAREHRNH